MSSSESQEVATADRASASHAAGQASRLSQLAVLHAACAFAIAQPLLVRLSTQSAFLLDSGTTPARLLITVCSVFFLPTLVLWGLVQATRPFGTAIQRRLFAAAAAAVFGLFLLQVARRSLNLHWLAEQGVQGWCIMCTALMLSAPVYGACRRRWFLRFAAMAAAGSFLFPVEFLRSGAAVTILSVSQPPPQVLSGRPAPVIVLVFDEFCGMSLLNDERQIDAVRYPNFARLAQHATWYRNATTVHARTDYAVPAILTGRLPLPDRKTTLAEAPQNLFTLLQSAGFSTAAFEPVSRLCPEQDQTLQSAVTDSLWAKTMLRCLGCVYLNAVVPADLAASLPPIPDIWYGIEGWSSQNPDSLASGVFRDATNVQTQHQHFLMCLPDGPEHKLCFLHAMTPHWPWRFLPDGTEYVSPAQTGGAPCGGEGAFGEDWVQDELPVMTAWQQYLLQVGDVDRRLGMVLDRLEQTGVFNDCLLVVAGDHGVSFQAGHSRRLPDGVNLSDILSVPLFIKIPGQLEGSISDRNVESIDVLPTIAAALEIKLPLPIDGESLLDASAVARPRKTIAFEGGSTVVHAEFPEKYRSLERMLETFGSGSWHDRLRAPIGARPELTGRRINDFTRVEGKTRVSLHGTLRDLYPAAGERVCYSEISLLTDDPDLRSVSLAIVHQGVILGTTRAWSASLIGSRANCLLLGLQQPLGCEDLDVFVIRDVENSVQLESCTVIARGT